MHVAQTEELGPRQIVQANQLVTTRRDKGLRINPMHFLLCRGLLGCLMLLELEQMSLLLIQQVTQSKLQNHPFGLGLQNYLLKNVSQQMYWLRCKNLNHNSNPSFLNTILNLSDTY